MTKELCARIESTIIECLRGKLIKYSPESKEMPFHYRLLGKDRMALFSFIHSLNTSFGTSIFEPVALHIASERFVKAVTQYTIGDTIDTNSQAVISGILDSLRSGETNPNKPEELLFISKSLSGQTHKIKATKVDLYLESVEGERWLFDIKSPKPNKGEFQGFKRTLLEWAAISMTNNESGGVHTLIAFPYNPYAPKPYERWTMKGLFDLKREIMIAEEFWDFLGGAGCYDELLDCFESAGIAMRDEIDDYFKRFGA